MPGVPTGSVERLLRLPASTLRYWEREVPLIAPRKERNGRRSYSISDVCRLLRLRHLALVRGFGLSQAAQRLEDELFGSEADLRAELAALRAELVALYLDADTIKARIDAFHGSGSPKTGSKRQN